jgi:DNA-binding response OmpR family regulator
MKKILICDDEDAILNMLELHLKREGYAVLKANNGQALISILEENIPHLIVLDVMLPDISGFEILKKITPKYKIPVIMLTAKSDIVDKVLGLEFGADDYMTKPFDTRELIARIRALLRRMEETDESTGLLIHGVLEVNIDERTVKKHGRELSLTSKEFDILKTLLQSKGIVFSREKLLDIIWGYDYFGDTRSVDIQITRLRKKLEEDPQNPEHIITVFGAGYKFNQK